MTKPKTAEEIAEEIVNLVCEIVYDDMPTSFDGLDFSPIAKALEDYRREGIVCCWDEKKSTCNIHRGNVEKARSEGRKEGLEEAAQIAMGFHVDAVAYKIRSLIDGKGE